MTRLSSCCGFTLVELTTVIVITGIVAASLLVFFKPTVDAYFDVRERADLSDMADNALRGMARDIRRAVPNSIRSPGNQCFELLPSIGGGRVRMAPDTENSSAPSCAPNTVDCSAPLDTSRQTTFLDLLSTSPARLPLAGNHIVIGNQNASDAYRPLGSSVRARILEVVDQDTVFATYRLRIVPTFFSEGYEGGRFTVVADNGGLPAVFYVCEGADGLLDAQGNGKGSLYRVPMALNEAYPTQCPATSGAALVADSVKSCNFMYSPNTGRTQQSGFVWLDLELAKDGETISLSQGVHVDNVP